MTGNELVVADRVTRTFGTGASTTTAVHDVTCCVLPGQQIALSGPSGSGKTTFLHLLAGLDSPTSGNLDWPALGTRAELRPGPVAVVFQAPSLLPPLDVVENVALPLLLLGAERSEAHHRAEEALALLELEDLASKLPEELSGGQAQRVAVARVLTGRPRLILADEPTGQLDHLSGRVVVDALEQTATHLGAALVVNTHDPAVSGRFDIRWTMHDGHLRVAAPAFAGGNS